MLCSDAQLRRLYVSFNRRYWSGKLPADTRVLWMPVSADCNAHTTDQPDGSFVIHISPALSGFTRLYKLILIHEMAHIALWRSNPKTQCGVGRGPWAREVLRVLTLGAVRYI